jgi:hypothetical protein
MAHPSSRHASRRSWLASRIGVSARWSNCTGSLCLLTCSHRCRVDACASRRLPEPADQAIPASEGGCTGAARRSPGNRGRGAVRRRSARGDRRLPASNELSTSPRTAAAFRDCQSMQPRPVGLLREPPPAVAAVSNWDQDSRRGDFEHDLGLGY